MGSVNYKGSEKEDVNKDKPIDLALKLLEMPYNNLAKERNIKQNIKENK